MIKHSIKIITLASLTVGLGLYCVPKNGLSLPSPEIKSTRAQNTSIPVSLPNDANVTLKRGGLGQGKMTGFDQQTITLEKSRREPRKIAITDIQKVGFSGEATLIHKQGSIRVRGGNNNSNQNNRETWQEPLTNFKIVNAKNGKAEVILSQVSKAKLRGIIDVSQTNTYVVDELSFNHDNNHVILTVIPREE